MDIQAKIKALQKEKGVSKNQATAIAYAQKNSYAQQGLNKNQRYLNTNQSKDLNNLTNINFTPEFAKSGYFITESDYQKEAQQKAFLQNQAEIQRKQKITDITSESESPFSNKQIWHSQKPEYYVGQEVTEGNQYTTIPYSKWESFKASPEYLKYKGISSQATVASKQLGGYAQTGFNPFTFNLPKQDFLQTQAQSPQQNFSVQNQNYLTNAFTPAQDPMINSIKGFGEEIDTTGLGQVYSPQNDADYSLKSLDGAFNDMQRDISKSENRKVRRQIDEEANPNRYYPNGAAYDIGTKLDFAGYNFGKGNSAMGTVGLLSAGLEGARGFLGSYSSAKESNRVSKEYQDKLYRDDRKYEYSQQGGEKKLTNAEMYTDQYIADEGQGNINMENNEFVKRADSGNVQKVVGEPHVKNGKKAEGVNATLNEGDKVLSDYTKIPAKNIKELKERYDLTLKKGATFADAQKMFDRKIGITKLTDELAETIENLDDNEIIKDATTKRLNELVLAKKIKEKKEVIDMLKDPQSMIFEDLFGMQELVPKKGDGSQLFDKKGKPIEETKSIYRQEGGHYAQEATNRDKSNYDKEIEKEYNKNQYQNGEQEVIYLTDEQVANEDNRSESPKTRDFNSARDQWEAVTGKAWSEAKRLGYTDGTAKDNIKLLNELKDSRFKKENLRTIPTSNNKIIQKEIKTQVNGIDNKIKNYKEYIKKLPKNTINQGNISQTKDKNTLDYISQGMEYLSNPLQTLVEHNKYGELPAQRFSRRGRTNPLDDVIGMINPARWISSADGAINAAFNEDYKEAGREALNAAGALSRLKYTQYLPLDKMLNASKNVPIINRAIGTGQKMIEGANKTLLLNQQGGSFLALAQKHGITPERAEELMIAQQGGEKNSLWKNIRANRGSGKKPTKQMLEQERKIKRNRQEGGEENKYGQSINGHLYALKNGADPAQVVEYLVKEGMSEEEATQLVQYTLQQPHTPMNQQGGEQQDQMQQVFQAIAQMMQEQVPPQEIVQQLVEMGVPQEQVGDLISQVAEQLSQQTPQQEQQMPQEDEQMMMKQEQEMAQQGTVYAQEAPKGKFIYNVTTGQNEYRTNERTPLQKAVKGQAYGNIDAQKSLQFLYNNFPDIAQKQFKDNITVDKTGSVTFKKNIDLSIPQEAVRLAQVAKNSRMNTSADVILNNSTRFSPEQVREAQRYKSDETYLDEAISKKGTADGIRGYDSKEGQFSSGRYSLGLDLVTPEDNQKLMGSGIRTLRQLKESPLLKDLSKDSQERVTEMIGLVGDKDADFSINEFIPTTPAKTETSKPEYTGEAKQDTTQADQQQDEYGRFGLPQRMWMPPPAMRPIRKEQIDLQRQEPIKATTEPYLAEQERQRQTDVERVMQSGLTPQQQEAMLASGLTSSQMASNDAISKVEQYNAQNQFATDQFNIGQRSKEDLTNAQYNQAFMDKTEASQMNNYRDWSNYYNDRYKNDFNNWDTERKVNLGNQMFENYKQNQNGVAYEASQGKMKDFGTPKLNEMLTGLTASQRNVYVKNVTNGMSPTDAINQAIKAK